MVTYPLGIAATGCWIFSCGKRAYALMVSLKRERGWADTAHTTEMQSGFCSVVRIGRSGRGCADNALATEWTERGGGGIANRRNRPVLKSPIYRG